MESDKAKIVWEGDYTNIQVVRREGIKGGAYCYFYAVWVRGDKESELPVRIDNVKFMTNTITVFDFMGIVYTGGDSKLNLKIYEYNNGVIQAEIRETNQEDS